MKIATTIGEVYSYTKTPADAIREYKGTGFKYLDYSFYYVLTNKDDPFMNDGWQKIILDAKNTAEELGFKFVQAHAPAGKIIGEGSDECLKATLRSIEACGMLGIKNMVIHSAFARDYKYPDDREAYFKANEPFFRALIPAMEKNGVNILFENTTKKHCGDSFFFPITAEDLNAFVDFMGHPNFAVCWDVGHANMDGTDQYTEIIRLGKNLKAIHVHDNFGDVDRHLAPFTGTMDYDALVRGLVDSGYDGYFTLESDGFFKYNRGIENVSARLAHPTLEIKKAALSLLYLTAKTILSEYGIYEE